MSKKKKITVGIITAVLCAILLWFLFGIFSPFEGIRKFYYQKGELISLKDTVPAIADEIHLTAHRGVNLLAPENTVPAYEKATELGYYSAECDIKQTRDGTWVLYHDPILYSRFQKIGAVGDKDLKTIKSYEYKTGAAFWEYKDLRIPTLDEYLDVFENTKTRPQIEIKTSNYDSLLSVLDAVKAHGMQKRAIIISFDLDQLKEIRRADKEIELWYLVYKIKQKDIDAAKSLGNCWLSADYGMNNAKSISLCLEQDVGLSLWTVDKPEDVQTLYDLGVRYIETDKLY